MMIPARRLHHEPPDTGTANGGIISTFGGGAHPTEAAQRTGVTLRTDAALLAGSHHEAALDGREAMRAAREASLRPRLRVPQPPAAAAALIEV